MPAKPRAIPTLGDYMQSRCRELRGVPKEVLEEPVLRALGLRTKPACRRLLERSVAGFESDALDPHSGIRLENIAALAASLDEADAAIARNAIERIVDAAAKTGGREGAALSGKVAACLTRIYHAADEGLGRRIATDVASGIEALSGPSQEEAAGTPDEPESAPTMGTATAVTETMTKREMIARYGAEEDQPPAQKRGRVEPPYTPTSIPELVRALEDISGIPRDSRSGHVAMERLPASFEEILRAHPDVILPQEYLLMDTPQGTVEYRFGGFFQDEANKRMAVMYVTRPTFETRIAVAYTSSSQASWRLLTDIFLRKQYDKGRLGEHAFNLPFEVQQALDELDSRSPGEGLKTIEAPQIVMSPGGDLGEHFRKREVLMDTMFFDVEKVAGLPVKQEPPKPRHVMYLGDVQDADIEGIRKFFAELPEELWPDFDKRKVLHYKKHSLVYGDIVRAALPSRNGEIRYAFNVTTEGTFLSMIEKPGGNINKYGLYEDQPVARFPGDIMTPLAEYPEQIKEGMGRGKRMGHGYQRVEGFHLEMPLLREANAFFKDVQESLASPGDAQELQEPATLVPKDGIGLRKEFADAAHRNDLARVKMILGAVADINAPNEYGLTFLMSVAIMGSIETAQLLVERGAYVNFKNADGMTALKLAERSGRDDMAGFLRGQGAVE